MSNMTKRVIFSIIAVILVAISAVIIYFIMPIKTKQNLKLPSSNSSKIIKYLKNRNYKYFRQAIFRVCYKPKRGMGLY